MTDDAHFIGKEPCPKCGSRDNLARYSGGSASCFTLGCTHYEPPTDGTTQTTYRSTSVTSKTQDLIPHGQYEAIKGRKISVETCVKMKYSIGEYRGDKAQIVGVPNQAGEIVAQKIRLKGKEFRFIGDTKESGLIFQNVWQAGCARKVVVTEGEMDALSVSQAQGNKYPVVSIPNGVDSALGAVSRSLKYLLSFDEIIIMFDMDDVGKEAAKEVAALIGVKAKVASLAEKDANELLKLNRQEEIISAVFSAQAYRPDGVVTLSSIKDRIKKPVEWGKPWIYDTLTKYTFGRRKGELYFIGAGSGIGKTDFMLQQIEADISGNESSAMFLLEQPVEETGKRLAGKHAHKRFHIPADVGGWTAEELDDAIEALDSKQTTYLYDHFGSKDWDTISANIRWLALSAGVEHFYIDHLTALVSHATDERREIERITAEMSGLAQELGICLYVISHLATPEGKSHEEGGQVRAKHFKGSRSIIYWAHFMFGLERNTQAEDLEERQTTTFRVIKDRYTGQSTGETFYLGYDVDGGILYEKEWEPPAKKSGFGDTTENKDF